ncbi:hypothetical protein PVMG_04866 [Plasmodium vivax Mauritania I]|uniref:PIR Superfamily Protein n=1 Tax=Plasmodium vivax Mauritania I TaxID=1035515 RepID=A0A0J9T7M2_PLAVI|nr:hypothetical protein PVMG_04866 [Plasmodium vivax Mauritania I]
MGTCYDEFRDASVPYTKYELFNKPVEVENEKLICEELSSKLSRPKTFKKFCYMLSKNITEVCDIFVQPGKTNVNCEFLNYWLYDALIKIKFLKDEENISQSSIMDKISKLWDASNCITNCGLKKYSISANDFKNLKELYDYSKHILAIENNQKLHEDVQCRKQYCSYIKKVDNVYNLVKSACNPQNDKPYCQILRTIPESKIPSVFLEGYQCRDDEINEEYIKDEKIFSAPLLPDPQETSITHSDSKISHSSTENSPEDSYKDKPEDASSNSSVKVGLSSFGMSLIPLFLIYKVKINVYYII